jgi:hypothetical protein
MALLDLDYMHYDLERETEEKKAIVMCTLKFSIVHLVKFIVLVCYQIKGSYTVFKFVVRNNFHDDFRIQMGQIMQVLEEVMDAEG